jgi:hypothetical protein
VAVPIDGFDIVVTNLRISGRPSNEAKVALPGSKFMSFALLDGDVVATVGAETAVFRFDEAAFRALVDSHDDTFRPLKLSDGRRTITFLPEQIYGDRNPKFELHSLAGTLLLRKADWE